jgi:hypothetical protein
MALCILSRLSAPVREKHPENFGIHGALVPLSAMHLGEVTSRTGESFGSELSHLMESCMMLGSGLMYMISSRRKGIYYLVRKLLYLETTLKTNVFMLLRQSPSQEMKSLAQMCSSSSIQPITFFFIHFPWKTHHVNHTIE